jgi:hypothetical protein
VIATTTLAWLAASDAEAATGAVLTYPIMASHPPGSAM